MCTAIRLKQQDFYFGRNLDLECGFQEKVVITPRSYPFSFKTKQSITQHYALIGMATIVNDYPLYAEAVNEKGLCMAGLNFPGQAYYMDMKEDKDNIAPFELIPYLLGQCASCEEAKQLLHHINIVNIAFHESIPLTPLHWMLCDEKNSLIIESQQDGLHIYEDTIGVLTNNPPYPYHKWNLNNYLHLTPYHPENTFSKQLQLTPYSQGMGAIGLPGDASSSSRFVRAAYLLNNCPFEQEEAKCVSQFFHILGGVFMVKGSVITLNGNYDMTIYSCCMNASKGIYYYHTYDDSQIYAVDMFNEDLDDSTLISYELQKTAMKQVNGKHKNGN